MLLLSMSRSKEPEKRRSVSWEVVASTRSTCLGTRQMRTTALFFCLLAYSHAVASICRGAGKAFVPMVIMLLFWCVVRITYITIVMRIIHEIQYIYMAYPITWSLSSIVYFLYYHFSDWVHGFDKKPAKPQET